MDRTENAIVHDIHKTRADLTQKMEMIIDRVRNIILGPKLAADRLTENLRQAQVAMTSATQDGIDAAHPAIAESMRCVQGVSHLRDETRREPWLMLGSALLMGYVIGSFKNVNVLTMSHVKSEVTTSRLQTAVPTASHPQVFSRR